MGGAPPEPVEAEELVQPSARRFRMFATLRWLVACVVLGASLWLLRGFDFGRVATTLRSARWPLVLLAAACSPRPLDAKGESQALLARDAEWAGVAAA